MAYVGSTVAKKGPLRLLLLFSRAHNCFNRVALSGGGALLSNLKLLRYSNLSLGAFRLTYTLISHLLLQQRQHFALFNGIGKVLISVPLLPLGH